MQVGLGATGAQQALMHAPLRDMPLLCIRSAPGQRHRASRPTLPVRPQIDNTYNKLQTLCEYIDDTEVGWEGGLWAGRAAVGGRHVTSYPRAGLPYSPPTSIHPMPPTIPTGGPLQDYINIELDSHRNAPLRVS